MPWNLVEEFNTHQVKVTCVPHLITKYQKKSRVDDCLQILEQANDDGSSIQKIITWTETATLGQKFNQDKGLGKGIVHLEKTFCNSYAKKLADKINWRFIHHDDLPAHSALSVHWVCIDVTVVWLLVQSWWINDQKSDDRSHPISPDQSGEDTVLASGDKKKSSEILQSFSKTFRDRFVRWRYFWKTCVNKGGGYF